MKKMSRTEKLQCPSCGRVEQNEIMTGFHGNKISYTMSCACGKLNNYEEKLHFDYEHDEKYLNMVDEYTTEFQRELKNKARQEDEQIELMRTFKHELMQKVGHDLFENIQVH